MNLILKKENIFYYLIVSIVIGVGISYSKLYLFHIFFALYMVFALRNIILTKKINNYFKYNNYLFLFVFMFFWYSLSVLWSANFIYSIKYLYYLLIGLSIIIFFLSEVKDINKLNYIRKILFIVFSIEILLCLFEIFTPYHLPVSPYSEIVHYFGRRDGCGGQFHLFAYVPTGFHWNPNNLAFVMILILPFFLFYQNLFIKIFGVLTTSFIIYKTGSRGILLSLIIAILIWAIFYHFKKFLITSVICFIFIFSLTQVNKKIDNKIKSVIKRNTNIVKIIANYDPEYQTVRNSLILRKVLVMNSINAVKKSYGIGVGAGNSHDYNEKNFADKLFGLKSMHNFWAELFIDSGFYFGLFFILSYIVLLTKLYLISIMSKNNDAKYYCKSCFLALSVFIFASMGPSTVIYSLPLWLLFAISIWSLQYFSLKENNVRMLI